MKSSTYVTVKVIDKGSDPVSCDAYHDFCTLVTPSLTVTDFLTSSSILTFALLPTPCTVKNYIKLRGSKVSQGVCPAYCIPILNLRVSFPADSPQISEGSYASVRV